MKNHLRSRTLGAKYIPAQGVVDGLGLTSPKKIRCTKVVKYTCPVSVCLVRYSQ